MGLGGRREKQVIAADPRNTRWMNDTSNPGHRLLTSMGYDPANASDSQASKTGLYGHSSSKRLRQIPIAKGGMEGIGFKPNGPGANVALGALPSSGGVGSMASAASSIFSRLGSRAALQFVTAGASNEVINRKKTEGGEFGGLLARLNAAASASATPEATDVEDSVQEKESGFESEKLDDERESKKQRKAERAAKRERKAAKKLAKLSGEGSASPAPVTEVIEPALAIETVELEKKAPALVARAHWNASRSRNLASKRMLHASAEAMAEILGIAPTPSPSTSGYSTPILASSSLPTPKSINKPQLATLPVENTSAPSPSASELPASSSNPKLEEKLAKKAAKAARKQREKAEAPVADSTVEASDEPIAKPKKEKKRKRDAI